MTEPVSIVVPVYNVEAYLDRCLESITAQTYDALEILLVDDGSTDGSPVLCDKWAKRDHRIRVIHKANEGLGMARNTGMTQAHGKYIFFFDSDDYVDRTLVEKASAAPGSSRQRLFSTAATGSAVTGWPQALLRQIESSIRERS